MNSENPVIFALGASCAFGANICGHLGITLSALEEREFKDGEHKTRPLVSVRGKSRDPVTTRYVASLFEAVGVDRVVTVDAHNLAAFQNAVRIRTEHLDAKNLFVEHFAPLVSDEEPVVVSPDVGGVKRAEQLQAGMLGVRSWKSIAAKVS